MSRPWAISTFTRFVSLHWVIPVVLRLWANSKTWITNTFWTGLQGRNYPANLGQYLNVTAPWAVILNTACATSTLDETIESCWFSRVSSICRAFKPCWRKWKAGFNILSKQRIERSVVVLICRGPVERISQPIETMVGGNQDRTHGHLWQKKGGMAYKKVSGRCTEERERKGCAFWKRFGTSPWCHVARDTYYASRRFILFASCLSAPI